MNKKIMYVFLNSLLFIQPIYSMLYGKIGVYAENKVAEALVINLLTKVGVPYETAQLYDMNKDTQHIYILAGDLVNFDHKLLPKYYIVYHTNITKNTSPSFELLSQAIAIWDTNWENINKYKNRFKNFYFLPNEQYAYLNPVMLPLSLPLESLEIYKEILSYSNQQDTDISSHLPALFVLSILQNPQVIIEAGVRGGESTIPLYKAAQFCNAKLIGLDIDPNCKAAYSRLNNAQFYCMNDVDFPKIYPQNEIKVDIVFIDTSHTYEQTRKEIACFVPLLNDGGALMFHDSNVTPINGTGYVRINNTTGSAIGNTRGVTKAIKEYFSLNFDEHRYCEIDFSKNDINWHMIHYPFCNGFTIIKKI